MSYDCDVPGCPNAWIFVQHENRVPVRRRCHEHWFADLKLASAEPEFPARGYPLLARTEPSRGPLP